MPERGFARGLEAEDEAGAEVNQLRLGDRHVASGAYGGAGNSSQSAVPDLRHAPIDMPRKGVIHAAKDGVVHLADMHRGEWGLAGALADGGLHVRTEGPIERLAGKAHANQEVAHHW